MFNMVDDEDIAGSGRRYEFKPQLFLQGLKKTRSSDRSRIARYRDIGFGGPFEAEIKGSSKAGSTSLTTCAICCLLYKRSARRQQ